MKLEKAEKRNLIVSKDAIITTYYDENQSIITIKDIELEVNLIFDKKTFNYFYDKLKRTKLSISATKRWELKKGDKK